MTHATLSLNATYIILEIR